MPLMIETALKIFWYQWKAWFNGRISSNSNEDIDEELNTIDENVAQRIIEKVITSINETMSIE